jgi:NAD(P)-dependent dehydrogenase (short-subunit alcohol dehydrogenase family)
MRLVGKAALGTGAQQGIGAATAIALARDGADVAINWLDNQAAANSVADQVRALGRRAELIHGDVSTAAGARAMVAAAIAALGKLDVLINNAGIYPRTMFLDLTEAMWDATHDVNLKGTAFASQAAAQHMVARKIRGAIVTISSLSAAGSVNGVHYSATKGGVISLTRAMALELTPLGIRVNGIAPGIIDTAQPRYGMTEDEIAAMGAASPVGRVGRPEEMAAIAVFLASDEASYITGEIIQANGGFYMA